MQAMLVSIHSLLTHDLTHTLQQLKGYLTNWERTSNLYAALKCENNGSALKVNLVPQFWGCVIRAECSVNFKASITSYEIQDRGKKHTKPCTGVSQISFPQEENTHCFLMEQFQTNSCQVRLRQPLHVSQTLQRFVPQCLINKQIQLI